MSASGPNADGRGRRGRARSWAAARLGRRRGRHVTGAPSRSSAIEGSAVDVLEHRLVGLGTGAVVNEPTRSQTDDPVAVGACEVQEVEVDDGRDAQLAVDALEIAHHLVGGGRVERRDRLVREDDPRLLGERTSDADPLLLSAREVGGSGPRLVRDAYPLECLEAQLQVRCRPSSEERSPARGRVESAHEHVVHDRRALDQVEALEDHADAGPDLAQLPATCLRHVPVAHQDAAARDGHEAVDGPDERRLAGAGQPDQDQELTVRDVQRQLAGAPAHHPGT